jgi:hypothetical protein
LGTVKAEEVGISWVTVNSFFFFLFEKVLASWS